MDKEKLKKLADLIFPEVNETVEDLEEKYPARNLEDGAYVTRIAPSPTGFLHTGTLFTVLVNRKLATQSNGVFYVRIENTDKKREVEGSIELFTEGLKKFGLLPMEGVISKDSEIGEYGPYTQSEREHIYKICAKYLIEKRLAYPCFCTPDMLNKTHESQEKSKIIPGYYGVYARCRNISIDEAIKRVESNEPYILRFRSNGSHLNKISYIDGARGKIDIAENDQDVVLIKSDGLPTYHFAHIVDDHFMRTTHVVRGEEWIPSTPLHIQLTEAMDFMTPIYIHLPLIMVKEGNSKRKLSKRKDKEAAVSYFVDSGYPIQAVIEYLLTLANSDYEIWRSQNLDKDINEFTFKLSKLSSAGSLLDMQKLNDISKEIISRLSGSEVLEKILEWTSEYDNKLYETINKDKDYSLKVFSLERENVQKIRKDIIKWEDIRQSFFYFYNELFETDIKENGYIFKEVFENNSKITNDLIKQVIDNYILEYNDSMLKDEWFENIKSLATKLGFCTDTKEYKQNSDKYVGNTSDFASMIRIAITNRKNTPDIYEIMKILGKEEVIKRLNNITL